ncbi:hypothetical protein FSP39_023470 [Pinctada imbricata]|uniref:Ileal sodium/bile acid cotransporter n=1 Tax=Pinctada imbricata TaxID=66713 RepID=A0AA89BMG7_PINIB|nr:hypothetical protein FSP39_023470 [Pinctada imbricata]
MDIELGFALFICWSDDEQEKFHRLGKFSNFNGKPFFLMFMDHTIQFEVNYTVFCEEISSNFTINVKTFDSSVMKVRQQTSYPVSCKDGSKVFIQNINDSSAPLYSYSTSRKDDEYAHALSVSGKINLHLYGELIGRTFIGFDLIDLHEEQPEVNTTSFSGKVFPVTVIRKLKIWDTLFRALIYFFMIFVTLAFGCKLDLDVVKENLKRPIAPGIGFLCQYLLMPMIAYAIAKLVTTYSLAVSLGIFLCGCCPGGGVSNIYTHLLDGDLSLSITMTTISTIAALGMLPLWVYTLGQQFIDESANVHIPYINIFTTLLILVIPIFVGIFIKYKLPKVKRFLMKVITPVTVVTITFLLSVGIYTNLYIFKLFNPRIIFAGCLLPYIGYILSGLACLIFRQEWTKTKTIAIETGIQNVGIAMLLMMVAFPPPDGELAAIAPIASGVMTPLPLFVITIIYMIYKRCNKHKYKEVSKENEDTTKRGDIALEVNGKEEKMNGHRKESHVDDQLLSSEA